MLTFAPSTVTEAYVLYVYILAIYLPTAALPIPVYFCFALPFGLPPSDLRMRVFSHGLSLGHQNGCNSRFSPWEFKTFAERVCDYPSILQGHAGDAITKRAKRVVEEFVRDKEERDIDGVECANIRV